MKTWGKQNPNLPNITIVGEPVTLIAYHNGPIEAPKKPFYVPSAEIEKYIAEGATEVTAPEIPEIKKGTIWGVITDCYTGRPIEGATVYLNGLSVKTSPLGKYEFTEVEPGHYSLYVVG